MSTVALAPASPASGAAAARIPPSAGPQGQPKDRICDQAVIYLDANPQVRAALQSIRQPSVDFRARCGGNVEISAMLAVSSTSGIVRCTAGT